MIDRNLTESLLARLDAMPAVALLGPRQIGKTTLAFAVAQQRDALYIDLQSPDDRARLQQPAAYFAENEHRLIILDEVHRVPGLFDVLRGAIDRNRRAGRKANQFVVLGSASLDLLKQSGESLAGRIAYLELTGINLLEHQRIEQDPTHNLSTLWLRGGFPESLLSSDDAQSLEWRRDFLTTYLERDIPDLGPRIPAETLRRFWTMLAHLSGSRLNASALSRSLGVDGKTVTRYLNLMVDLLLVRRLQPWHGNISKRLVKSPKVYVRDSGILHTLLGISSRDALLSHPKLGDSFEGFVIENLMSVLPSSAQAFWYGTGGGAEIDLVIEFPDERWAIEIKHSRNPTPARGFHEGCRDVEASRRLIVYPGQDSFSISEDVRVVSIDDAMQMIKAA